MKKIRIIILVLVIIMILLIGLVFALVQMAKPLSDEERISLGLDNAFSGGAKIDKILEKNEEYQFMKSYSAECFENEIEFSTDVDIPTLDEYIDSMDDEKLSKYFKNFMEELDGYTYMAKIGVDLENEKIYTTLDAENDADDEKISAELLISENDVFARSKELNRKFIKSSVLDVSKDVIFNFLNLYSGRSYSSNTKFSEDEENHFSNKYGSIFDDYVCKGEITSNEGTINLDNEDCECIITISKLNKEMLEAMLTEYVETFENDEKGKEIIKNKWLEILKNEVSKEEVDEYCDEIFKELPKDLKERIDFLEDYDFDFDFEFITYTNKKKLYANEYKLTISDKSIVMQELFEKENIKYTMSYDDKNLFTCILNENEGKLDFDSSISGSALKFYVDPKNVSFKYVYSFLGSIELNLTNKVENSNKKELYQDGEVKVNIRRGINLTIPFERKVKVIDELEFPKTKEKVNIEDSEELEEYINEAKENLENIKLYKLYENIQNRIQEIEDEELERVIEEKQAISNEIIDAFYQKLENGNYDNELYYDNDKVEGIFEISKSNFKYPIFGSGTENLEYGFNLLKFGSSYSLSTCDPENILNKKIEELEIGDEIVITSSDGYKKYYEVEYKSDHYITKYDLSIDVFPMDDKYTQLHVFAEEKNQNNSNENSSNRNLN